MKKSLLCMTSLLALAPFSPAFAQTTTGPVGNELAWSSAAARVGAFKARPWAARGKGVTVAVIDTGINKTHQEFTGAITGGYNAFTNKAGIAAVSDANGHGTHVASLIGARANNVGMTGTASLANIMAVQVFQGSTTSDVMIARGINYATSQKAFIMNMSLGSSSMSPTIRTALQASVTAGQLSVIAAGNEGQLNPSWPARHASEAWAKGQILVVGAVDANNVIASFSNRAGDAKNFYLVAPGVNLIGAYHAANNGYVYMSGTSMAAPVVAGGAAVVKSAWPYLTAANVAKVLLVTATDLGVKGVDSVYGYGLMNLEKAMLPVGGVAAVGAAGSKPLALSTAATGPVTVGAKSFATESGAFTGVIFDDFGRDFDYNFGQGPAFARPDSAAILGTTLDAHMARKTTRVAVGGGRVALSQSPTTSRAEGGAVDLHFVGNRGQEWSVTHANTSPILGVVSAPDQAPNGRLLGFADHTALFADQSITLASLMPLSANTTLRFGGRIQEDDRIERHLSPTPLRRGQSSSVEAMLSHTQGAMTLSGGVTAITEQDSRLGDIANPNLALRGTSQTVAFEADAALAISQNRSLSARLVYAQTDGQNGATSSLVTDVSNTKSAAFALNLATRNVWTDGDQLDLAVGTPLSSTSGLMNLYLATGADPETGAPIMTRRSVSLTSKTPEMRLAAIYTRPLSESSELALAVQSRFDADGRAGEQDHAIMVRYQTGF